MTRKDHVIRNLYPKDTNKPDQLITGASSSHPMANREHTPGPANRQRRPHAHALEAVNTVEQNIICLHTACVSQYEQITYTFSNEVGQMF
jgi:hypothetical protein